MVSRLQDFDDSLLRSHLERRGFSRENISGAFQIGERQIPLLAFSHRPFDTRTACISAAPSNDRQQAFLKESRASGAPLAFVGSGREWNVWRQGIDSPELFWAAERGPVEDFFEAFGDEIDPRSLFRAKVDSTALGDHQSTFVEAGLLEMVEGEVSGALCKLVEEMVTTTSGKLKLGEFKDLDEKDAQWLVQANFWLLAARLLHDKKVQGFKTLDLGDIDNVLTRVGRHYGSPIKPTSQKRKNALKASANLLQRHSSLRLVSTETLAQVYENVLVTKETRKALGTHSTPAWLVDYMVKRLAPWVAEQPASKRRVFEPGCGHAPFLVGFLRHFSAMKPCLGMADEKRHEWLKARLYGAELDDFAREVARLSLTLADIPNANGWFLQEGDMFEGDYLEEQLKKADIIVSNPPFEAKPGGNEDSFNLGQAVELLRQIEQHAKHGALLAYIMPQTILNSPKLVALRKRLLSNFEWLEVLRLPGRIFENAEVEVVVLLGRKSESIEHIRKISFKHVWDSDIDDFCSKGIATFEQLRNLEEIERDTEASLLIPDLVDVWDYCRNFSKLKDVVSIGRGFEYKAESDPTYPSGLAKISAKPAKGYEPGFYDFQSPRFSHLIPPLTFMLKDERAVNYKMSGFETGVGQVVMNHSPVSREGWRNLAYLDLKGHFTRSRFLVVRTLEDVAATPLLIWALLNSPVANAFTMSFSSKRDILASTVLEMPVPKFSKARLGEIEKAALKYREKADQFIKGHTRKRQFGLSDRRQRKLNLPGFAQEESPTSEQLEQLKFLHWKMDAAVLDAYELPPELERKVLDFFTGHKRVGVPFEQTEYYPEGCKRGRTLNELIAVTADWNKTNRKRMKLIDKEYEDKLSASEESDLERLQNLASLRRNIIDPYPLEELDAQIERMKREGKWTE